MSNGWISLPIAEGGIGTPCIICGETVPIDHIYDVPKTCDKCKKAVIYMRERMEVTHEHECMSLPPLKPCPFCGGEATFGKVLAYMSEGRNVKCVKCGARSNSYLIDTPKMTFIGSDEGTRMTVEEATQNAAVAWNRRAGESND